MVNCFRASPTETADEVTYGDTIFTWLLASNVNNTEGQSHVRECGTWTSHYCLHYDVHNRRCNKPRVKGLWCLVPIARYARELVSKSITSPLQQIGAMWSNSSSSCVCMPCSCFENNECNPWNDYDTSNKKSKTFFRLFWRVEFHRRWWKKVYIAGFPLG